MSDRERKTLENLLDGLLPEVKEAVSIVNVDVWGTLYTGRQSQTTADPHCHGLFSYYEEPELLFDARST